MSRGERDRAFFYRTQHGVGAGIGIGVGVGVGRGAGRGIGIGWHGGNGNGRGGSMMTMGGRQTAVGHGTIGAGLIGIGLIGICIVKAVIAAKIKAVISLLLMAGGSSAANQEGANRAKT